MNRVWPVLLKSIAMLMLWVAMAAFTIYVSMMMRSHLPATALIITGVFYVIFSIVCFVHLCDSTNKLLLILLLLTQTVLIYPLCLKIWRAFTAAIEKDQAIRKQKILKATYANWSSMKPSVKKLPDIDTPHMFGSCVPSRPAPPSPTEATGQQDASLPDEISPALEVTNTRFQSNTRTIRLSLDTPNIYGGEPNVCKYVTRTLKHLLIKKKLSYHIITNSSQDILHVSKSKAIPAQLPDRVVQEDPLVICNDNHYIISFVKCLWFENFEVTKRSDSKIENYEQVDLNKFIWPMVWPATVILFYAMFDLERFSRRCKIQLREFLSAK